MRLQSRSKSSTSRTALQARDVTGLLVKASHGEIEFRADTADGKPVGELSGYGSKFDEVDAFNESIKKGAFRSSLAEWRKRKKPIPMLWQHFGDMPIGAWTEFREDDVGLFLKGQLIMELPQAQEALHLIKADVVTGLSIGYMEIDADPYYDPDREGPRIVRKVDLREVSVVTFPALREAQLDAVKACVARGERPTASEFRGWLQRELGLSPNEAGEISEKGYAAWLSRTGAAEVDAEAALAKSLESTLGQLNKPLLA